MRLTLLATAALILWSALVSPVTASAAAASPVRQVGAEELALELATSDRVAGTASARSAAGPRHQPWRARPRPNQIVSVSNSRKTEVA